MQTNDLATEIENLAHLKEEHGPLLAMIAADGGMKPETRRTLVEHIYEEEEQKLQRIAALRGGESPALAPAPASSPNPSGLTVGSLMMVSTHATVGSLRPPERPSGPLGKLTVGSLRQH